MSRVYDKKKIFVLILILVFVIALIGFFLFSFGEEEGEVEKEINTRSGFRVLSPEDMNDKNLSGRTNEKEELDEH